MREPLACLLRFGASGLEVNLAELLGQGVAEPSSKARIPSVTGNLDQPGDAEWFDLYALCRIVNKIVVGEILPM